MSFLKDINIRQFDCIRRCYTRKCSARHQKRHSFKSSSWKPSSMIRLRGDFFLDMSLADCCSNQLCYTYPFIESQINRPMWALWAVRCFCIPCGIAAIDDSRGRIWTNHFHMNKSIQRFQMVSECFRTLRLLSDKWTIPRNFQGKNGMPSKCSKWGPMGPGIRHRWNYTEVSSTPASSGSLSRK